eukprot:scaffold237589_cov29-Tisochrysis_lutea.AAC.3
MERAAGKGDGGCPSSVCLHETRKGSKIARERRETRRVVAVWTAMRIEEAAGKAQEAAQLSTCIPKSEQGSVRRIGASEAAANAECPTFVNCLRRIIWGVHPGLRPPGQQLGRLWRGKRGDLRPRE